MIRFLLPFITAMLAVPFAGVVIARWRTKHRPYLLLWAIGIVTFGLGAGAEAAFHLFGWRDLGFRVYYLCGAILTAAWLGQGTIQLLGKRPWPQISLIVLTLASLYGTFEVARARLEPAFMSSSLTPAVALVATESRVAQLAAYATEPTPGSVADVWARAVVRAAAPLPPSGTTLPGAAAQTALPPNEPILGGLRRGNIAVGTSLMLETLGISPPLILELKAGTLIYVVRDDTVVGYFYLDTPRDLNGSAILRPTSNARSITPLFNVYGTLGLAGGAIYSAWIFLRKRVLFDRMLGNILIATGALSPALGGTLSKAGVPYAVQISNLIGLIIIYSGFLQATRTDESADSAKSRS